MQDAAAARPERSTAVALLHAFSRRLAVATLARFAAGAVVLGCGAYLRFYRLGEDGIGNSFYASAARSMGHSLHNFFFVSFDPLGTYMVDKPPVGLWLQALSAHALGYDGFALMLPQAVAGLVAVVLTFWVARALHGEMAAFFAAAVLAVMPASVLVARNNTMDTVVVALVLAAIALSVRAAGTGRLVWLLAAGAVGGVAFNVKGFEALLALPGVVLYVLLASTTDVRRRLLHLLAALAVLVAVGLSWTTAVALTPADSRPTVLNSDGNSIWSLTFIYNGLDRIRGGEGFNPATALTSQNPDVIPLGVLYGGERGPGRLLGEFPAPLVAMALPLAVAGALLLLADLREARHRPGGLLWLLWLGAGVSAFSASRLGSAHYLESFSPALAVCAGVGCAALAERDQVRRLVGAAGVGGAAAYALTHLTRYGDVGDEVRLVALATAVAVAVALALALAGRRVLVAASGVGIGAAALAVAIPLLVSWASVRAAPVEGILPGTVYLTLDGSRATRFDPTLTSYYWTTGEIGYLARPLAYLERQRREGQYAAAMTSFYGAAPVIAKHDLPILPLYSEFRQRPEMPAERLRALIDEGSLPHFMVSIQRLTAVHPEAAAVVRERCRDVSREAGAVPQIGVQVYRCQ